MPMMPLLMGLDHIWRRLESLEREHRTAARRPGFTHYDDFDDQQARAGRVDRVRSALFFSGVEGRGMLAARLAGIDLSTMIQILLDACKDVAVCWGGSVLAGGALGGTFGAFAGGVGAIPGATIGAGLGAQIGGWVLGMLGLKALIEDLGTAIPDALRHYEAGFRMAWGPVRHWESADSVGMDRASHEFALGHLLLMMAMLTALMAYLTRGRGDPAAKARILQEIRESPRLGNKVADWVAANEEALAKHPGLKPKEQQVVMMSEAKPPAGPPVTPSQLRRLKDEADPSMAQPPSGPRVVVARAPVALKEFNRLNVPDPAAGKFRPGEAGAAAEMQAPLGGTLNRAPPGTSADFDITTGQHAGKSVDFMLTPDNFSQATKINQFFEKNLKGFEATLRIHLEKADLVPIDTRFLTPRNNQLLMDVVSRVPPQQQVKIILIK
jgi:hypothetical protein